MFAALLAFAAPAQAKKPRCPAVKRSNVVAKTKEDVAFKRRLRHHSSGPSVLIYACNFRRGTVHVLNPPSFEHGREYMQTAPIAFAGELVAFVYAQDTPADGQTPNVMVRRLTDGLSTHRYFSTETGTDVGLAVAPVTAIVLKPHGAVAWIATRPSPTGPPAAYEVHVADTDGKERMVASSLQVGKHSLRLSADKRTVSWTEAGVRHSAPIS